MYVVAGWNIKICKLEDLSNKKEEIVFVVEEGRRIKQVCQLRMTAR